ncbi:DUF5684 domain-containing protein [Microbacterium sp. KCTC 39802]|uniref:DUF5684 domain-containing protein n=3 Tax=Microbacterium TaxID=33882 RepID=UPI000D64C5EC|nr:DUF5684 domain-containing protein [Microbacterium sp. KCTC 39802]
MNATDATAAVFGLLISLLLSAGLYVWIALALSAVFRKSGVEPWKAWVPILNAIVLLQLAGLSPWLVLLGLVPIVNVVVFAFALYRVNLAFGLGAGMTVLGVLLFPVWASVVGWGSARWIGREQDAGARRTSGEAAAGIPPLPPFPTPASRSAEAGAFPPAAPHTGAHGFAPPPAQAPPAGPVAVPPPGLPGLAPITAPRPAAGVSADDSGPAPAVPGAAPVSSAPVASPPDGTGTFAPAGPAVSDHSAPVASVPGSSADGLAAVAPPAGGWTPPPLPGRPVAAARSEDGRDAEAVADPWQGFALDSTDLSGEVTGAVSGAPAPISAVPAAPVASAPPAAPITSAPRADAYAASDAATTGQGITRPPVTRVPAAAAADGDGEPWAPARSPMSESDSFPEASGPVSAVAGAPDAGAPRSARSSVSAFHAKPEIPDEQDVLEETIIARRKRTDWTLLPPTGDPVALSAEVVILGRRPAGDPDFPGAQLVSIPDGTVSKTHARLELRDDRWYVTDLDSTNGVLFATVMGTEVEAPPGEEVEAGDRFLLGDAEVRLQRSDG